MTKALVCTVCKIENHDGIRSGISADEFCHKGPLEWSKEVLNTIEDARDMYIIEVIAESHF